MKIICLTEESVEFFYDIEREDVVHAVSVYAVRPKHLKPAHELPRVSAFTKANIDKIVQMKPDLVIGYSDVQKNIAHDLVDQGVNVLITHQRTLSEIYQSLILFSSIIGEREKGQLYVNNLQNLVRETKLKASSFTFRPLVYFEEWDEPRILASPWIHEIIEICGGRSLLKERSLESHKALRRQISNDELKAANPDLILFSWCGKKGDCQQFLANDNLSQVKAVRENQVYEISSDIILQPGPAAIKDGIPLIFQLIQKMQPIN